MNCFSPVHYPGEVFTHHVTESLHSISEFIFPQALSTVLDINYF